MFDICKSISSHANLYIGKCVEECKAVQACEIHFQTNTKVLRKKHAIVYKLIQRLHNFKSIPKVGNKKMKVGIKKSNYEKECRNITYSKEGKFNCTQTAQKILRCNQKRESMKKSCIQETLTLFTCADSSINTK